MSVCLSVRMEQLGFHQMDFHEIWYLSIFRKSVEKVHVSFISDKNKGTLYAELCTRNCTYSVTLRCVRATIVAVENNNYYISWVCVCSLNHPAYNASAHRLYSVRLYNILQHYLTKGTIFEKKVIERKMCFDVLYNVCPKHFPLQEERTDIWSKMYIGVYVKYPLYLPDL